MEYEIASSHQGFERLTKLVGGLLCELVKRVAKPSLTDQFQRSAARPHHYIDLSWTVDHTLLDCFAELYTLARVSHHDIEKTKNDDDPVDDTIEGWHHVAHMVNRKDRIEKLALLAVMIACATHMTYQLTVIEQSLEEVSTVPRVARRPGPKARFAKLVVERK